jgi:signal transduction histidine kinase
MSTSPENLPTGVDFATEVKTDRLTLLWKVTLAFCLSVILLAFSVMSLIDFSLLIWFATPGAMAVFCLLTQRMLETQRFEVAALTYTAGAVAAIGIALLDPGPLVAQTMPYFYVVVVFMVGLLLRPQITFIVAVAAALLTVFIPVVALGSWDFLGWHQVFAILLMFIGALLAAQVTGELYAVTEWSLENYQRERRTNLDLFENRLELQRTLQRTEALSERLKETNIELAEAHQTAEAAKNFRGQFLANMSHELRTPLNAIIGFSETMLQFPVMYDNVTLGEKYRADLDQIYTSGQQLLHVINDILDLARVDAGRLEINMQAVELPPIVDAVISTSAGLIGSKPITLESDLRDALPVVYADPTRVRQVLLNLYSNAAKFTDEGSITLRIRQLDQDTIQCSVIDTGVGIHESQMDVIFEEFRQSDNRGRDPRAGAGLGLAISRQLLTLMGGRIWVESEPGKGSAFHFTLRLYRGEQPSEAGAEAGAEAAEIEEEEDATEPMRPTRQEIDAVSSAAKTSSEQRPETNKETAK